MSARAEGNRIQNRSGRTYEESGRFSSRAGPGKSLGRPSGCEKPHPAPCPGPPPIIPWVPDLVEQESPQPGPGQEVF